MKSAIARLLEPDDFMISVAYLMLFSEASGAILTFAPYSPRFPLSNIKV